MTEEFDYTVAVVNEGAREIRVMPFALAAGSNSTVAVGNVMPGGDKGVAPFMVLPDKECYVRWVDAETGDEHEAVAYIELPKEFTPAKGKGINFHIQPETRKITVTYEVLDESGEIVELQ